MKIGPGKPGYALFSITGVYLFSKVGSSTIGIYNSSKKIFEESIFFRLDKTEFFIEVPSFWFN